MYFVSFWQINYPQNTSGSRWEWEELHLITFEKVKQINSLTKDTQGRTSSPDYSQDINITFFKITLIVNIATYLNNIFASKTKKNQPLDEGSESGVEEGFFIRMHWQEIDVVCTEEINLPTLQSWLLIVLWMKDEKIKWKKQFLNAEFRRRLKWFKICCNSFTKLLLSFVSCNKS